MRNNSTYSVAESSYPEPIRAPGSSQRIYVDAQYLQELHRKAKMWEEQTQAAESQQQLVNQITSVVSTAGIPVMATSPAQLAQQLANMLQSAMHVPPSGSSGYPLRMPTFTSPPPSGRGKFLPDPAVPLDRTILIRQIPNDMRNHEVAHSILAPGGIRYLRLHRPASTYHGPNGAYAIVTFVAPNAAHGYADYVKKNGFYLSRRVKENHQKQEAGETVVQSADSKFWHLLKHLPFVQIKMFNGIDGHIRTPNDGDFCDIEAAIQKEGATRVLKIMGEEKQIRENLKMIMIDPNPVNNIEALSSSTNRVAKSCMFRFYSIRDAVVVKRYLELQKDYDFESTGRTVAYHRDPFDKPTMMLGWDCLEGKSTVHSNPKINQRTTCEFEAELPNQMIMSVKAHVPSSKDRQSDDDSPTIRVHVTPSGGASENQRPGLPWEWVDKTIVGQAEQLRNAFSSPIKGTNDDYVYLHSPDSRGHDSSSAHM